MSFAVVDVAWQFDGKLLHAELILVLAGGTRWRRDALLWPDGNLQTSFSTPNSFRATEGLAMHVSSGMHPNTKASEKDLRPQLQGDSSDVHVVVTHLPEAPRVRSEFEWIVQAMVRAWQSARLRCKKVYVCMYVCM